MSDIDDFDHERWAHACDRARYALKNTPRGYIAKDAEEIGSHLLALARTLSGKQCRRCGGFGVRAYANTSTWRGGIGGQAITNGICDVCWGTGRHDKTGVDRRKIYRMQARMRDLEAENARLKKQKRYHVQEPSGWLHKHVTEGHSVLERARVEDGWTIEEVDDAD